MLDEPANADLLAALKAGGDNAVVAAQRVADAAREDEVKKVQLAVSEQTAEGAAALAAAVDDLLGTSKVLADPKGAALAARLVVLVDILVLVDASKEMCWQATTAARALKTEGNFAYAEAVIRRLEYRLSSSAPIYVVLRGMLVSCGAFIVLGLAALLIYAVSLMPAEGGWSPFVPALVEAWGDFQTNFSVVAAFYGLLGAVVSILLRIHEFDRMRRSQQYLLMSGAVLPIVGVIFALVACSIFASGIISSSIISGDAEVDLYFYIVLGFLSGFSERFVRGLLDTIEGRTKPQDADPSSTDTTPASAGAGSERKTDAGVS